MIASLPMYDRPETRPAWDRFWSNVVQNAGGLNLPNNLTWDSGDAEHWLRPDLALSQTCSLPYRTRLQGDVTLLGAIDFGIPGCPAGYYNSILIMRHDDLRQAPENWPKLTLAYNAPDSQSGWAAPFFHAKELGLRFTKGIETGAHRASAYAVASGEADIAAIDGQTFRLLRRFDPFMETLIEVGHTEPTPGLPLITSTMWNSDGLWPALVHSVEKLSEADRDTLDLQGIVKISAENYLGLPVPPSPIWASLN